jgi:hypothetical protein
MHNKFKTSVLNNLGWHLINDMQKMSIPRQLPIRARAEFQCSGFGFEGHFALMPFRPPFLFHGMDKATSIDNLGVCNLYSAYS